MAKKMLIDATHPEETRVVVVDGQRVEDFDFESINKRQLAGNIYLAKVIRVEPSLQAAFVDYGGNRHGFLAFSEIHPDYYQIPAADREALIAAEAAQETDEDEDDERPAKSKARSRARGGSKRRSRSKSAQAEPTSDGTGEADPATDTPSDPEAEAPSPYGNADTAKSTMEGVAAQDEASPEAGDVSANDVTADSASDDARAEPEASAPPPTTVDETGVAQQQADPAAPDLTDETATQAASPDAIPDDAGETVPDAPSEEGDAPDTPKRPIAESAGSGDAESVSEDYVAPDESDAAGAPDAQAEDDGAPSRAKPRRRRSRRKSAETEADAETTVRAPSEESDDESEDAPESVAAESVEDEVRPRRVRARNYKIQEVIRPRQIVLVQVVKEERGNKGAALTTYLSLAGRYCVLMPNTARGGGISRKITNAADRKKLKDIAGELDVPTGMGLIIRTAGAQRTRTEIKRDYEFLLRQWEQVRELTLKSIAPTLIYEEGSLIKRSIRDIYSKEIDEVLVGGEEGYREAKDYMRMLMPSHAKNVQPYRDAVPLFSRYQVENYLAAMFNPTVQLKSGGYIVIGVTEALVAIDVNSGRSTREGSIEETALKTNLEAAEEVARQLRLRDLAGLIVIDFIDMDERRNNAAVERRMKEKLKNDRARIQVGRISAFGLMEMSRQRLRPGMLEASTTPCPHCHGTGIIRSEDSLALSILRDIEDEGVRGRSAEVRVVAPTAIANFLFNRKRAHMADIEARYGLSIAIEGDPALISPDYRVEKIKGAGPVAPRRAEPATISAESAYVEDEDIEDAVEVEVEVEAEERNDAAPRETSGDQSEDDRNRGRRRRGKRGGRKRKRPEDSDGQRGDPMPVFDESADEGDALTVSSGPFGEEIGPGESVAAPAIDETGAADATGETESMPVDRKTTPSDVDSDDSSTVGEVAPDTAAEASDSSGGVVMEAEANAVLRDEDDPGGEATDAPEPAEEPVDANMASPAQDAVGADLEADAPAAETVVTPETPDSASEPEEDAPERPKRRGWWNIARG